MGVLEKFTILFESDAKDSKKDVTKLGKALDKTEKEAKDATKATGAASKQFVAMGTSALGAAGGVVAIGAAIAGIVFQAGRIDEIGKFASLIDESVEDVDAWSEAVIRAGGSGEGFRGSVESLTEKLKDAATRGSNEITPFFNELGISIVDVNGKFKSTLDLLPELAGSFENISKQKALGLGKKLGLDVGTIALLQQGREEVDKLIQRQNLLGVTSEDAAESSAIFNDTLADMKQITNFAAQSFIVNFLPAINWMLDKFVDLSLWTRENKVVVYGFFAGLAVVAIPVLFSLAAAGWAAIAPLLVMAAPFIGIAAAAALVGAAIALVTEDIMAFISGNESLLGSIVDKWPIVGAVINGVVDGVRGYFSALKEMALFLFDLFTNPLKALEKIKAVASAFGSFLGFGGDADITKGGGGTIAMGQEALAFAGSTPLASQTSNSIQNNNKSVSRSTSVQTGDIVIHTQATDADGIASEASGSLDQQLRSTVENFDDGIAG